MSQLKEELVLDAGGFNREMDEATGKVEKFDDASKKAGDSIKQMGDKGAMSTKDLLKEIGKLSREKVFLLLIIQQFHRVLI